MVEMQVGNSFVFLAWDDEWFTFLFELIEKFKGVSLLLRTRNFMPFVIVGSRGYGKLSSLIRELQILDSKKIFRKKSSKRIFKILLENAEKMEKEHGGLRIIEDNPTGIEG